MNLAFSYVRHHLAGYLAAMVFLLVEVASDLAQPTLMAAVVDKGVQTRDLHLVLVYGAAMVGVALAGAVGAAVRNVISNRVSQAIGVEMRADLYHAVQRLSFENIDRLQAASIITRMTNDVTAVVGFINSTMRIAIKMPITCIGAMILIVYQTPDFAPLLFGIILLVGLLVAANMRVGRPRFVRLQQSMDRLNGVAREFLSSIRVVKAFGAQEQENVRFTQAATNSSQASIAAMAPPAVCTPLVNLVVNGGIVLLLWVSRAQSADEIGRLMASLGYMAQLAQSLGMLNVVVNEAVRASVSSRRIQEVLSEKPAQLWVADGPGVALPGSVAFEGVSFTYAGASRPSLRDITFGIAPGQTLGIIGSTGSGKTTLVNLVPRFYDATEGTVFVGGLDVMRVTSQALRATVAVVPQTSTLFSGTIAENLRWGNEQASDEEIRAAARIAQADGFVSQLPNGYETQLGQGGVNLSGGQRQRLCIARALVRRPTILVLDDCTSALDATTERAVLEGLARDLTNTTVLLVSQRIATVRRAPLIVCLDRGRVCGLGTHEELLRDCAVYRDICASQAALGDGSAGGEGEQL